MFDTTVNELAKYTMSGHHDFKNVLASDIVSHINETFHVHQAIKEAGVYLSKKGLSGLPVVDASGKLCGFLSAKDCLRCVMNEMMNERPLGNVEDYMSKNVISFSVDDDLFHILQYFVTKPFLAYPVLDEQKLVGIITRSDILKVLMNNKSLNDLKTA